MEFLFANKNNLSYFHSDQNENTSISIRNLRKLMRDSVQLQKMKITNQKLKKALNDKLARLRHLEKRSQKEVSLVSAHENEQIRYQFFL